MKFTKNYMDACGAMIGKTYYLYNPFESTIHEVYIQDLMKNMFGEPDEIYAKLRLYADEKGIKDVSRSWEKVKAVASFSYLANELMEKKLAIISFHADLVMKQNKLEEESKSIGNALQLLHSELTAISS
jgi:hypothetical protein